MPRLRGSIQTRGEGQRGGGFRRLGNLLVFYVGILRFQAEGSRVRWPPTCGAGMGALRPIPVGWIVSSFVGEIACPTGLHSQAQAQSGPGMVRPRARVVGSVGAASAFSGVRKSLRLRAPLYLASNCALSCRSRADDPSIGDSPVAYESSSTSVSTGRRHGTGKAPEPATPVGV